MVKEIVYNITKKGLEIEEADVTLRPTEKRVLFALKETPQNISEMVRKINKEEGEKIFTKWIVSKSIEVLQSRKLVEIRK